MDSAAFPAAASGSFEQHDKAEPLHTSSLHPRLAWMICYNETRKRAGGLQQVRH